MRRFFECLIGFVVGSAVLLVNVALWGISTIISLWIGWKVLQWLF